MNNRKILLLLIFLVFSSSAWAKDRIESGEKQVHLLELYSSEGCSSCPPADRWLAAQRKNSGLWKSFVPVEFHVDYWNYLGWHDPFSKKQFTNRQRKIAATWGAPRIYTPGVVLNGNEWRWRANSVQDFQKPGPKVGNLVAQKVSDRKYVVQFSPKTDLSGLELTGVVLGNGLSTDVKTGENAGEKLNHEFVVLKLVKKKMNKKEKVYTATIDLNEKIKASPKSLSIAFWVSKKGSPAPIQAVGGDL